MHHDPQTQPPAPAAQAGEDGKHEKPGGDDDFDGLADKKPEELTPEELRLMADTMPGDSPGD
jgi:hypothetical protein